MEQRATGVTDRLRDLPFGNGPSFYVLLTVYLIHYMIRRLSWQTRNPAVKETFKLLKTLSRTGLIWAAALAFGFFAASLLTRHLKRYKTAMTCAAAVPLTGLSGIGLTHLLEHSGTSFDVAVAMIILISAIGRDFERVARVYLLIHAAGIAFGMIGIPLGVTENIIKPGLNGGADGYALGLMHANLWAREVLLVLFLLWYLYSRKSVIKTLLIFGGATAAIYFVSRCRTVALLAAAFAIAAVWVIIGEKKAAGPAGPEEGMRRPAGALIKGLLAVTPIIGFLVTLILALNMETVLRLTYGTLLQNTAKRFVQSGIALQRYGIKLFGQTVTMNSSEPVVLNGQKEWLYVLDNGYIGEGIERGAIYLTAVLASLTAADFRAIAKKKTGLLLIGAVMALMAFMERSPLVIAYNFLLLYPLSAGETEAASPVIMTPIGE